ncbi:MAG: glycosyltransferase, partial [Lachnospiraceae bacterium]|nr:glycosyltransferase [Lachnospiraceae bacterium]
MREITLISVVIPVYNKEKYLRECLDSVLAQTYGNMEIILVDDASSDASGRICDEYARRDGRVLAIHLKENRGVSHARNIGI